ncbi:MAG: TonB-dependent receptor plug [Bacteroidetes bacterium]|uniref:SusC/RagA family TonB-linked outer membrane protein n=1 Tax=Chitinophaga sp. LS1 TaxID=3051176 RepID=UPI001DCEDBDE|nr:SusC/RagA family TonB-linked outer membrane protein [Chitinophaga sp. LS1]MBP1651650.1 TonB-dependent receptor plug [Bacteroidota bacterium]WPV68369.1 SusC/RagA family TonB-linked outer membrane protein [Chitinophaga sp. LS1]
MKKFSYYLSALLAGLLFSALTFAQSRVIQGTVTDENTHPLSFVSVNIKGTNKGVVTDKNGVFSLEVAPNATLIVRAVGFLTKEVGTGSGHSLTITLAESASDLNEVVVTALGVKKEKRNLTFSSQEVKSDEILRSREPNIVNTLTGKVAGVQVTNSSGMPGSSSRIVVRGITSLNGENQALIVMDGVPVNNDETDNPNDGGSGSNRLSDIDPSVIESINLLKGAAATAMYGSAGARGVLLITTKKGSNNRKPTVTLSSGLSFEQSYLPDRQTTYSLGEKGIYSDGETTATQNKNSWGARMDTLRVNGAKVPFHNPAKEFFKTGISTNNTVSVSGGNASSSYFLSYTYFNQQGTIPNTDYTRHNLFAKYTTQILDNLSASFQLTYSSVKNNIMPQGWGLENPLWTIFAAPVSYNLKPYLNEDGTQRMYRSGRNNPYWVLDNVLNTTVVNRYLPVATFVYSPTSWLSVTERMGADMYQDQLHYHVNVGDVTYTQGLVQSKNQTLRQFNHDFMVQLRKEVNPKLNTSLLLGNNVYSKYNDAMSAYGLGLAKANYYNMASASSVTYGESSTLVRKVGFYAQGEIDYNRTLIVNLTGRYDGSSVLSSSNRYYPYGSAAAAFIFSELLSDKLKKTINFGKFRASYAVVGNDNVGAYATNTPYYQAVIYGDVSSNLNFPYNGQNGFLLSTALGNPNLKNELQKELEFGLEMKFLDNRLGFETSWFDRKMSDGLVEGIALPNSTGYSTTTINSAKMETKGLEVLVNATPVRTKDFSWDVTLTYTKMNNKVTQIGAGLDETSVGSSWAIVGQPWGVLKGTKFARTDDGQLRINSSGLPYSDDNSNILGNVTAKWLGSITNQFRYKQFGLSFFFDTKQGGQLQNADDGYNLFYGVSKVTENRADRVVKGISDATGQQNTVSVTGQQYWQQVSGITEQVIQDASYIKLRNVSFSYSLGQKALSHLPFRNASLILTGRNLWIHKASNFSGPDPEANSWGNGNSSLGLYSFTTPTSRSFDATIKITF